MTMTHSNKTKPLPKLLTIDDVAEHCQVSTKTVRGWVLSGELGAHRLGWQYRISEAQLALFLTKSQAGN